MSIKVFHLTPGLHHSSEEGTCLLEVVSILTGGPFTDHPENVSPALAAFCRSWNDGLGKKALAGPIGRHLLEYAPRLVNTLGTPEQEKCRAGLALDWLIRKFTARWLELAGLTEHAQTLRELPEQSSVAALANSKKVRDAAKVTGRVIVHDDVVMTAIRSAAGDAAWNAAWPATKIAKGTATWNTAWNSAWAATWTTVWAATKVAKGNAIEAVVTQLQESAFDLLDRMIAVTELATI